MRRLNEEINKIESRAGILAKYFLKAILLDKSFITKCLSIIVAVAYCLAHYMLGISEWVRFLIALII